MMVIVVMTLVILLLFSLIKINSVVHGSGVIITKDNTQVVSLSKGGTIDAIHVAEGDFVTKGQVLAETSNFDIQKENERTQAQHRYLALYIKEMMSILAWRQDYTLFDISNITNQDLIGNIQLLISQTKTKDNKINSLNSEIERLGISKISKNSELMLVQEEVNLLSPLVKKGISSYTTLLAKKQAAERLKSELIDLESQVVAKSEEIKVIHSEINDDVFTFRNTLSKNLVDAQHEAALNDSAMSVLQKQMKESRVRSPIDGVIYQINKNAFTKGGVIQAADSLFEIKPMSTKMLAEVKIQPTDRDQIYVGGSVNVKILSFILSGSKPYTGVVEQISPDSYEDTVNGNTVRYYKAIVEFTIGTKERDVIKPGMTVDAFIITGNHSILKYLATPLLRGLQQVFSEPVITDSKSTH
ncbi:HlyD family type I secretion periplasmic adaptor subunit [Citrobacter cronae]|uniref:HlyD family type I secretion periplasmic adaptor subunit n=1 Tax=Citrobacter cronae TaxID=1748967 RepID=UPI001902A78D|nr:HlyD family type I secretion periplasmic adaptor subunit [Citrobacter cronae]MBJ8415756.1 HlyD family type I secretion periplasmic adaptor subunit [Citrobacter cronae]